MPPLVLTVDPQHPQPEVLARAAEVLRRGGLVAFPTETVYGLGADALSDAAVRRIFAAKGRPANNPVIVHVADVAAARSLTTAWPATAEDAARRWWPGPLTIVLPKADVVPSVVAAGGSTVAIRCPAHPVARALIAATDRPLAAPSANRSTRISATLAEHVVRGLGERVDLILDGGPTTAGLESTVVDLSGAVPKLLRPGPISLAALRDVFGPGVTALDLHAAECDLASPSSALPSPGLLRKHYAPTVPVRLVEGDGRRAVDELTAAGARVGWMPLNRATVRETGRETTGGGLPGDVVLRTMPGEPTAYAACLYAMLHELEQSGVAAIVVEQPPDGPEWAAVRDRLQRASAD